MIVVRAWDTDHPDDVQEVLLGEGHLRYVLVTGPDCYLDSEQTWLTGTTQLIVKPRPKGDAT